MQTHRDNAAPDDSVILAFYRFLTQRWRAVALGALAGIIAFGLAGLMMTPRYRADVVLAPQSNSPVDLLTGALGGQLGGLGSFLGLGASRSSESGFALAVLESVEFTRQFVREEDLQALLLAQAKKSRMAWLRFGREISAPTELEAVKAFDEGIRTVIEDSKTGLVTIRVEWPDRVKAADWANKLAERVNEAARTRAISDSERVIEQVRRELAREDQVEVRTALSRLLESQLKRRAFAMASREFAFRVVDPAVVPDAGRIVAPRRALLMLVGLVFGVICGLLFGLVRDLHRRPATVVA